MSQQKDDFATNILNLMKAHFGNAAKAYWVYVEDRCPGCQTHEIDELVYKGERALSINGFMYREKGVLIGYFLCGECAKQIMSHARYEKTDLHKAIEKNLISAYERYIASLDA